MDILFLAWVLFLGGFAIRTVNRRALVIVEVQLRHLPVSVRLSVQGWADTTQGGHDERQHI